MPDADREQYLTANAPALVADLEAQVARQRAELHKLNQRCAALTAALAEANALQRLCSDGWMDALATLDRLRAELDEREER